MLSLLLYISNLVAGGGGSGGRGGRGKKDAKLDSVLNKPLYERIRGSDSSSESDDALEEPFPFRSPREKASRGRGSGGASSASNNKQRKGRGAGAAGAGPAGSRSKPAPASVKKGLSSKAEAFLASRDSQLNDILVDVGVREAPQPPPPGLPTNPQLFSVGCL